MRISMRIALSFYFTTLLTGCGILAYTPTPRWGQAVALIQNGLFIYGGRADQYNMYSYTSAPTINDLIYLPLSSAFNTASPPWQLLTSNGPAVAWHTITPFNSSSLLLFGGDPGSNSLTVLPGGSDSSAYLNVASVSHPLWTVEPQGWANQPPRRIYHTASSANGKIYIIGGARVDATNVGFFTHYVFDPSGPSFELLPSGGPPDLVGHSAVVTPKGILLVFGGFSATTLELSSLSKFWAMDTTSPNLQWTTLSTNGALVPPGRRSFAAVVNNNVLFIHGGSDAALQTTYSDGWMLNLDTMEWNQSEDMSQSIGARKDHFAVGIGGQILIGFGYGSNGATPSNVYVFDSSSGQAVTTVTPLPSQSLSAVPPTATSDPSRPRPPSTSGSAGAPHTGGPMGTKPSNPAHGVAKPETARIVAGTVFAIIGVLVGVFIAAYYVRRRRVAQEDPPGAGRFYPLGPTPFEAANEDAQSNKNIPVAGTSQLGQTSRLRILNTLGLGAIGSLTRNATQRRDILADEDTRTFGFHDRTNGSSWSVFSMFGGTPGVSRGRSSREGSVLSRKPSEKDDPFGDHVGDALLDEPGAALEHERSQSSRTSRSALDYRYQQPSYAGGRISYTNPFDDPLLEESVVDLSEYPEDRDEITSPVIPLKAVATPYRSSPPRSSPGPSTSPIHNIPADLTTELRSPGDGLRPLQLRSSIIDSYPNHPIQRSPSWWSRFSRTTFLDRRTSDAGRNPSRIDFRDPNPPPRLGPIRESKYSVSTSTAPDEERNQKLTHEKSTSSFKTTKTADSEAIERVAAMDVIQRADTNTSFHIMEDGGQDSPMSSPRTPRPLPKAPYADSGIELMDQDPESPHSSATDVTARGPDFGSRQTFISKSPVIGADDLHQEQLPTSTRRTSVKYGLVPKPSLYVANPDRSLTRSSDS